MVTLRSRGEIVGQTETVQLRAQFRGFDGNPADLSFFPEVSIIAPSGNVILAPTRVGVYRVSTGLYGFDYTVGINENIGVYTDYWSGNLDGYTLTGNFNFVVLHTQVPAANSDGYEQLGDDPGFHFSQTAIRNINKLLKSLKARLNSSGKVKTKDQYGNDMYIDCDIFSVDTLVTMLCNSLTMFNQTPMMTTFNFDQTEIIDQFHDVIVQGATIMALASKALIERGREYSITDNGISFQPPTMSEILGTQWNTELTNHTEKVKYIKAHMRSNPIGLGGLSVSSGGNPAIRRLRLLRERRII